MNVLIVCYSRTGITMKVSERIAQLLRERGDQVTVEQIVDRKKRKGILGFLGGGKDAVLGRDTDIGPIAADVGSFDLVVVGTPVWANSPAPAARMFMEQQKEKLGRVAFLCTMGGSGDKQTFTKMQETAGKEPDATLALKTKHVRKEDPDAYGAEVHAFVDKLAGDPETEA